MLCEFCNQREAVDHRFHVPDRFASVCERCKRLSIPPKNYMPSEGDFCLATNSESEYPIETAGTACDDDDARPRKSFNYV